MKVKLIKYEQEKYKKVIGNSINRVEKKGDIFTFECSELKAKLYFPQFLGNAEILEPKELREWFKQEFEKTVEKYR